MPASPKDGRRDHTIFYQYRADRARRTLRGIDEQVAKAQQAIDGKAAIKRNRFVQISGGTRELNQHLIDKTRALAGIKGYVTNLPNPTAEQSSAPTTSCGRSRKRSGCPNTTSRPGRSTTTSVTRSTRT